jgi:hypothetical protein
MAVSELDQWKERHALLAAGFDKLSKENERLRAALRKILAVEDDCYSADWAEIEDARLIARDALSNQPL